MTPKEELPTCLPKWKRVTLLPNNDNDLNISPRPSQMICFLFHPLTSNGQISLVDERFTTVTVKEETVIEMGNKWGIRYHQWMDFYHMRITRSTDERHHGKNCVSSENVKHNSSWRGIIIIFVSFDVFISFFMTPFKERLLSRVNDCLICLSLTTFMLHVFR